MQYAGFFYKRIGSSYYTAMLYIILSIFVGLAVGLRLHKRTTILRVLASTLQPLTLALLFVMGINLGTDRTVWKHLGAFGLTAAVLAVFSVAGSILAGSLYRLLPGQRRQR